MPFNGLDPVFVFLLTTLLVLVFGTYFSLRRLLNSAKAGYADAYDEDNSKD